MAVGFPLEARRGFTWWGIPSVAGAFDTTGGGPYYMGIADFPRLLHDSGTRGILSIGSWRPFINKQFAGRDEGGIRLTLSSGTPGLNNSSPVEFLRRCVRYCDGPAFADQYGYMIIGGGIGQEGDNGFYWTQSGARATRVNMTAAANQALTVDVDWWALYPWQGELAAASHLNEFTGAANDPFMWYDSSIWLSGVVGDGTYSFAQKAEFWSCRVAQDARRVHTLGGATSFPTVSYGRGARFIVPNVQQDIRISIRWLQPEVAAWTLNNFTPYNLACWFFDGVNSLVVTGMYCEPAQKSIGPSSPSDYLRMPIEYVPLYVKIASI
jgi:hypothetical protein